MTMINEQTHGTVPGLWVPSELYDWLSRPRQPVLHSTDMLTNRFIEAMITNRQVDFIYMRGSQPGTERRVHVALVFQHQRHGPVYISGYCPERQENRVYALDGIMIIHGP